MRESFGAWRAALHEPPGEATWARIVSLADELHELPSFEAELLPYALELLARLPREIPRRLPFAWMNRVAFGDDDVLDAGGAPVLPGHEPRALLANELELGDGWAHGHFDDFQHYDPDQVGALCASPHLKNIRRLAYEYVTEGNPYSPGPLVDWDGFLTIVAWWASSLDAVQIEGPGDLSELDFTGVTELHVSDPTGMLELEELTQNETIAAVRELTLGGVSSFDAGEGLRDFFSRAHLPALASLRLLSLEDEELARALCDVDLSSLEALEVGLATEEVAALLRAAPWAPRVALSISVPRW